jgi:hypothetical protein
MKRILCSEAEYTIEHEYEQAYLRWPGGTCPLGDHYGDPTCAVMNATDGWCVTGGEGLVITLFHGGFPVGSDRFDVGKVKHTMLWRKRDGHPPPHGERAWFVEGACFIEGDRIQVVVDPGTDHAGLYEVNIRTLAWHKV